MEISDCEVTFEPPNHKIDLPSELEDDIKRLFHMIQRDPILAIPILEDLKERHSGVPEFYNFLINAYSLVGDEDKALSMVKENYERHPDCLFARTNYAETCLARGDLDEIPIIFDDKFDPATLYPERKRFHVSEVASFMGVVGRYFALYREAAAAKEFYDVLKRVVPGREVTTRSERLLSL